MGDDDHRRKILRRCLREAGYGVHSETVLEKEIREGDVGTLTESLMADDTAGFSHRIPAGMEVKVVRVEFNFIGFYTGDVIEGENYFITPLTLEFRRKFRGRGASPTSSGERPGITSKEKHGGGGSLHKMALTLEGRSEAMQDLVAGINKMGDERFWRFYNWWIENKESELVPWLD